jgi:WD40 repeat protein
MANMFQTLFRTVIVLSLTTIPALSQSFVIVGGTVAAPNVTMRAYGFDAAGAAEFIDGSALTATVSGMPVSISSVNEPATTGMRTSVYVMVDASSSASSGSPTTLTIAKAAAALTNTMMTNPGDEIGLAGFDERPTMVFGLSSDRTFFDDAVNDLGQGNGSSLQQALFDPTMGGLTHLQSAVSGRTLLLILDGASQFDVDRAIADAETFRIKVYVIGIRSSIGPDAQRLAERSGGAWVDGLTSQAEVETHVRAFISAAKGLPATRLSFTSPTPCILDQNISVTRGSVQRSFAYSFPQESLPTLQWSDSGLEFGTNGSAVTRSVLITNIGTGTVTISDAVFSKSGYILPSSPWPMTLQRGESRSFDVRYVGGQNGTFVTLTLQHDGCPTPPLYLRAGSYSSGDVLTVTAPVGGERFVAGSATHITWTNILPDDLVRIEHSTDNGVSWRPITETAKGHSYMWKAGPIATTQGLIRIERTTLDSASIITAFGHVGPVYTVAFGREDRWIFSGGHDGTVRMWDATTGRAIRQLGTHGDWVTAVASHPALNYVISGSRDAAIRVWDYETGQRVASIPADQNVYSLEYSPDGTLFAVGTERRLTIYSATSYQQVATVSTAGRVHSLRFSKDSRNIVCSEGSEVVLRPVSDLSTVTQRFTGSTQVIYGVAISPDAKTIAACGADFTVRLYSASTGQMLATSTPATAGLHDIDFSPSGAMLLTAGGDGTAKTWRADDLAPLASFGGHIGTLYTSRFDRSGDRITTSSTDQTVRVWTIRNASIVSDESDATFSVVAGSTQTSPVAHGTATLGTGTDVQTAIVTNTGTDPIDVIGVRMVSGDIDDFALEYVPTPRTLAPSQSLNVITSFIPSVSGSRTASLAVETGAGILPITLSGTGQAPPIIMAGAKPKTTSSIVDFGRLVAAQAFKDTTLIIQIGGTDPVTVNRVTISGVQTGPYSIVSGGGSFTVSSGQPHSIKLRFEPFSVGRFAARLVLTMQDGSTLAIRLYGEGSGDARISSSQPSLIFQTDLCTKTVSQDTLVVSNIGTVQLFLSTIEIAGLHASEFRVVQPTTLPASIAGGDSAEVIVRFTPLTYGSKEARLVITSNATGANNGRIEKPLLARQDTVAFELSVGNMVFDNVIEGQTRQQQTSILNTGTVSLRWNTRPVDLGDFIITRIEPEITPPGGQTTVTVQFKGGKVGQVYTAQHVFTDSICGRSQTLQIKATVKNYIGFTFAIDTVSAAIGTTANVPVRIQSRVNYDRVRVSSVTARMSVNGTILTPLFATENMFFNTNGIRTFDVVLPISATEDLSATLPFRTTWGNDTAGFVRIDSVWSNDTLIVVSKPGMVKLSDLCREGGARLIRRDLGATQGLRTEVVPHPVADAASVLLHVVEHGPTTISVVSLTGKEVLRLSDETLMPGDYVIPLDGSALDPGPYLVIARSRTQHMSHLINVVR